MEMRRWQAEGPCATYVGRVSKDKLNLWKALIFRGLL